ncbi:MAG TPA: S53 family peptidase [Candidatus Cybelea sp.]|nr:S53 family peptidase [Candidatus Cybelea sp.]
MRLPVRLCRAFGVAAIAAGLSACSGSGTNLPASGGSMQDLGRAGATTRVDLAVVLKYHQEAQLDRLIEAQGTPGSSQFHHFLTPAQFARTYGPTQADYDATIAALRGAGFTITHTFANRTVIDAGAPAPVAERLFSTEIHNVRLADGERRYTNVRPESIPASLAPTVFAVVGLDSATSMRPQYRFKPGHHAVAALRRVRPNGKKPLFGPDGGYGPGVFRKSYIFPNKMTGQGRATAFVGNADFLNSDLAAYLAYFGEKQTGTLNRVLVDGGPPSGLSGDSVEATLDVETIASIDPATNVYAYEAPESATLEYFTDAYNQVVTDNLADDVSTSYSECETAFIPSFPKAAEKIFKQGAALGITFHSSTGDDGTRTYGCNGSAPTVGTPTDTPENLAIGGTIMAVNHTNGKETSEVCWSDDTGATGGGVSVVFKVPSYQKGVTNVITSGRNLPDLAFDASPNTGESFYYDGTFEGPIGGTSLSSPIFAAGLTVIDEIQKSRQGYFNPNLYATWGKNGYSAGKTVYFRDITSGSIGAYSAQTGYDQVSGIGVMLFGNFEKLLK